MFKTVLRCNYMDNQKQQSKINVQELKRNALKNIPPKIKEMMIDTSKYNTVKKNSHEILMEMRYGKD